MFDPGGNNQPTANPPFPSTTGNTSLLLDNGAQVYGNMIFQESTGSSNTDEFALLETMFINYTSQLANMSSATEVPYTPYERRPETYIVPILFAIIFVVGVLGNGTLIIVFLRHRAMRNVPNTYILSLALADLLLIVTTVPFTSIVYTLDSWPWGSLLCTSSEFIKDVSIGVSVFTLTALSGDRFFAIVDPLRKFHAHGGGRKATRMTIAIAVFIWVLAIVFAIPAIVGTHIRTEKVNKDVTIEFCYPFPGEWGPEYARGIVLCKFLAYYAIPLCIIALFYVLIARHLIHSAKHVPGETQGTVRQVKARRKVAITVLAFVVIFGICFLPSHLFMLWFYYNPNSQEEYNQFWHVLRIVGFCLSFANSCANPVALYCVSGAFRKHFNRYLLCEGSSSARRRRGDNLGHRDTSLTSTMSRRYPSKRFGTQSMRINIQETTIVMLPNGASINGNYLSANIPDRDGNGLT
ncbi:neuropeptide CCHamide-1 receptor [Topomyia yanbarensis]|uniref:neuropeptide CCHamide-1 receptor n=1 Tax=Topomyia yanbarensis TaxID=2498891 RepID=UPI00273AEECC|nr:neuropeptide CCHamide-1 receptor [Topomyia yanbarensis]XP_058836443.1 neuropeptide CCHamide-1 receptor [Topomyia yanbarensis]